jgi:hypothetical protein
MPKEVMIWNVENETAIQNRSLPKKPSPKLSGRPCSGFTASDGASIWASSDVLTPWLICGSSRIVLLVTKKAGAVHLPRPVCQ